MHRVRMALDRHWIIARRLWSAVLLIACALLSLHVVSAAQVVRVGFYENAPKLYTNDLGEIVGFFPKIIEYIAAQEGWTLEYVSGTWSECLSRLEAGEIDLMPDVGYSEQRAAIYGFAGEPLFINWGIIYTSPDSGIESIPDLVGKRIAVMEGSIHTEGEQGIKAMLSQFDIRSTYVEVLDYKVVFEALQAGEADVGVVNRLFGLANEKQYGVRQTPIVFNPRELRFAYPLGSELGAQLVERIDEHVRSMKTDPDSVYYRSIETYLLGKAPDVLQRAPRWLPWVLGGAGGLIVFSGLGVLILRRRQRRLRRELATSEIRFDAMFEQAAIGLAIADPETQQFLRVNARFCDILGYTRSELAQLHIYDVVHPEDLERDMPVIRELSGGLSQHLLAHERCIRKDGAEIWGALSLAMVRDSSGKPLYWIDGLQDITKQKKAEQELAEHRENLERLVVERTEDLNTAIEAANAAMFRHNLLTDDVERDQRWFEIAGITQEDFDGTHETWRKLVHPDDLATAEARIDAVLKSQANSIQHEYRIVRPDGGIRYIESRSRVLRDDDGRPIANVGMDIDITERKKADEALRESEAFLRSMIEHMPFDFFAIDRNLRYVMQSPGSQAAIGDVIGKSVDEIDVPAAQKEQWTSEHRQVLAGKTFREENDIVTRDGELRTYLTDIAPVHVGEEIVASIGMSIDITDRKRSEERIRQLSRAIEECPVSVVITDTKGTIEYVNPKYCEVTGYAADEVVGGNPRVLKAGDQPESFYKELWDTILAGNEWRGEFCNKKKSGDLFWELASISPIRDESGSITHFVAIKEDITERKHVSWELEQAKRDAEFANQAKSDFLANMSHELRTPLNAVIGFSEVLEDGTFGDLNDKQRQYVGNILQSGRHLLSLINDILDLSKIEAGKMELEIVDVDVSRLIFESLIFVQEKAHQHRLELVTDLSEDVNALTIQADERMLKQVLFNLLSNATKFTPDNGTITVEGRIHGSDLLVRIRDTGIGMKPEDLLRVFEEFKQLDASYAKTQQGTGLGLALAKRLVELHEGRIWAESEGEGRGSTFAFALPLQHLNRKEGRE